MTFLSKFSDVDRGWPTGGDMPSLLSLSGRSPPVPQECLYLISCFIEGNNSVKRQFVQHWTPRSLLVKASTLQDMEWADPREESSLSLHCVRIFISMGRIVSTSPLSASLSAEVSHPPFWFPRLFLQM